MRPGRVILKFVGAIAGGVASAIGWLRLLRPEVVLVTGKEQSSQLPLTVLCAVRTLSKNRNYVLQVIFGNTYVVSRLGRYWIWNLDKALADAGTECPIIVAELRQCQGWLTPWRDWFLVPQWLWGEIRLPRDAQAKSKVSGDLRRIRRHGLVGEVTQDPSHFDDFYYNMYLPYITETFGDCAGIATYRDMKKAFRRGGLLLIKQGEKAIAGQLVAHYSGGSCLENMGIRDGNRAYVQEGAGCALYHFGLEYLQGRGITTAWVAWSRPFLRDGVLRFKRKWSQRLADRSSNNFAIRVSPQVRAARSFLTNNPFVTVRSGKFYGAVFTGEQPPSTEDLRLIERDYYHPGMIRLVVYALDAEHAPSPSLIPSELKDRLELRGFPDVPGAALVDIRRSVQWSSSHVNEISGERTRTEQEDPAETSRVH